MTACTSPSKSSFSKVSSDLSFWQKEVARRLKSIRQHELPNCMVIGSSVLKWEEESTQECLLKVDKAGFFLVYQEKDKEAVCIDLSHVTDVRRPSNLPKLVKEYVCHESDGDVQGRCFSICYGLNMVDVAYLHFASPDVELVQEWTSGLHLLTTNRMFQNPSVAMLLKKQYSKVMLSLSGSGKVQVKSICKCFNASRFEQRLSDGLQALDLPFGKADEFDPELFTFEKFCKLYYFLCPRQDMDDVFVKMSGGRTPYISLEHVLDFCNKEQRDPRLNEILFPYLKADAALKIIEKFEPSDMSSKHRLSMEGFTHLLQSKASLVMKSEAMLLNDNMDFPLNQYFISSSHNTYLSGRQFGGKSSVEMYRQVLMAGCRCIELDCWDGTDHEPIITHGKAMCSNINFREVLVAIKEAAFITSPFPVILSLENHCSRSQQGVMAKSFVDVFGDMLLSAPLDTNPLEEGIPLPSPSQLLFKILIKNKKLTADAEQAEMALRESSISVGNRVSLNADEVDGFAFDQCDEDEDSDYEHNDDCDNSDDAGNSPLQPSGQRLSVISELSEANQHPLGTGQAIRKAVSTSAIFSPEDSSDSYGGSSSVLNASVFSDGLLQAGQYVLARPSSCEPRIARGTDHGPSPATSQDSFDDNFADSVPRILEYLSSSAVMNAPSNTAEDCSADLLTAKALSSLPDDLAFAPPTNHLRTDTFDATCDGFNLEITPSSPLLMPQQGIGDATSSPDDVALIRSRVVTNRSELTKSRAMSYTALDELGLSFKEPLELTTSSSSSRSRVTLSLDSVDVADGDKKRTERSSSQLSNSSSTSALSTIHRRKKWSGRSATASDDECDPAGSTANAHVVAGKHVHPLLSSLVNYVWPLSPFTGFEKAEEANLSFKMSSFNEGDAFNLVKTNPLEFVKYNRRQNSRIYPKGSRVDSSNYMPQVFWNVGCQMVALNLQTCDLAFQLNQAKFECNGRSGYLLKPGRMRRTDASFDPFTESPIDGVIADTVTVQVISGQFLSDKRCGTYVQVDMYGLPTDTKRKNRTKLTVNSFMNTVYNEDAFVFRKVVFPELALLRFAVYDESDKLLGQRVLPLTAMQPGYRHIPLRSESNLPLALTTIFVHITLKTYVPEKYGEIVDELYEPMKHQSKAEERAAKMQVFGELAILDEEGISRHKKLSKMMGVENPSPKSSKLSPSSRPRVSDLGPIDAGPLRGTFTQLPVLVRCGNYLLDMRPVSLDSLRKDKNFLKLQKRHAKMLDFLGKKHAKEVTVCERSQMADIEKLKLQHERNVLYEGKVLERNLKKSGHVREFQQLLSERIKPLQEAYEHKVASLTAEWQGKIEEVRARQEHDEVGLLVYQALEEIPLLRKLLTALQEKEQRLLDEIHCKEMAELIKSQTRHSIEEARTLTLEREVKSKDERNRILREQDKLRLEQFKNERQKKWRYQEEQKKQLKEKHQQEDANFKRDREKVMVMEKERFRRATLEKQKRISKRSGSSNGK